MPQPRGSSSTSARLAKSPSSPCIAAENGAKLCEDLLSFLNLGPEIPIKLKLWILRRQMQNMYILLTGKIRYICTFIHIDLIFTMYINICKYICDIYQRNLLQYKQVSYIHGDPWLFCFTLTPDLFVLQAASPFPFGVRKHSERLPLSRRANVRRAIASGGPMPRLTEIPGVRRWNGKRYITFKNTYKNHNTDVRM